ncbi:hypothetical protein BRADI_4g03713v3 [Brachypodium distachyon]|uniref:[RNA-polymerase]-subunit kinase n=1 Tax=Brachypodium distachyon TaxID=15368 RepID=A0A2K2CK94_BRADI|nr:hypothetical protein BRADI_4g03713v3 [Brachypodium distachyon]
MQVGQGTYSSVFRAWDLDGGRAVALKKVRFDASEPGSVRFMAREIIVLRRLHGHPNVVSLHGLIVPRSSPNHLYLVLEFLPHDLAALLSSQSNTAPFSPPQIKSYMRQLMAGLEHCHGREVMHRDIKSANLLVSAGGELKVADFGLANLFFDSSSSSPSRAAAMTSRVVTLWYRPPELLLGATAYGPAVDLWSAGCVFAELHAGRPVLQGRTEVEQIHKIFKLCGSPAAHDDGCSWAGPGLAAFRPQTPYESRLRETFAGVVPDEPAFALLETLLSVDPRRRGTAAAALASGYFAAARGCEAPSALPLPQPQPPQRAAAVHAEESLLLPRAPPPEKKQEAAAVAGPVQLAASTGFAWAKKPRAPPAAASKPKARPSKASAYEAEKQEMMKQWEQITEAFCTASSPGDEEDEKQQSYNNSSSSRSIRDAAKQLNKSSSSSSKSKGMARVDYSGPLLSQPGCVDELLRSHEQHIRRRAAARRSWFHKGSKREQQQPCQ